MSPVDFPEVVEDAKHSQQTRERWSMLDDLYVVRMFVGTNVKGEPMLRVTLSDGDDWVVGAKEGS